MKTLIENIIIQLWEIQLWEIQDGKIWIGKNFNEKISAITENEAFIRPIPNLHSVAEIISHLTIWRKETILKIKTGKGSMTDDSEENWLNNDKLLTIGWNNIKVKYKSSLNELVELLQTKEDSFLKEKYYDTDFKGFFEYKFVIYGMLHHDIYHLGQLGIIIKFLKEKVKK